MYHEILIVHKRQKFEEGRTLKQKPVNIVGNADNELELGFAVEIFF
jgi:hypothetical protein